jgi:hypothetical protein
MIRSNDNTYKFNINGTNEVEIFLGEKNIEVYDPTNPSGSGFIFDSFSDFIYFCNCITDIIDEKQKGR